MGTRINLIAYTSATYQNPVQVKNIFLKSHIITVTLLALGEGGRALLAPGPSPRNQGEMPGACDITVNRRVPLSMRRVLFDGASLFLKIKHGKWKLQATLSKAQVLYDSLLISVNKEAYLRQMGAESKD